MKEYKYSVLKKVKNLKLAKNRKPSDVFSCLTSPVDSRPFKITSAPPQNPRSFLSAIKAPKQRTLRRAEVRQQNEGKRSTILERIKREWPSDVACKLTKKKRRAKFKSQFTPYEYSVFVWYVKSCVRGAKHKAKNRKRHERGVSPRRLQYENFINSPLWEQVKNGYYQRNPRRCAACDTYQHINLHHMVYGNFGEEKDEELVALCSPHHKQYHTENGTQRNMLSKTTFFIVAMRKEFDLDPSVRFTLPTHTKT